MLQISIGINEIYFQNLYINNCIAPLEKNHSPFSVELNEGVILKLY